MKTELIQKQFITYNLKIKGDTPYHILLIEASLSPIESMVMFRYLIYKNKLYNTEAKRFPKIASNSSQNPHLRLKQDWHKDAHSWLNHWGIKEELSMGSNYSVKNTLASKFKDKLWEDHELEGKRKLRYYKEVINPTLNNQNYQNEHR